MSPLMLLLAAVVQRVYAMTITRTLLRGLTPVEIPGQLPGIVDRVKLSSQSRNARMLDNLLIGEGQSKWSTLMTSFLRCR